MGIQRGSKKLAILRCKYSDVSQEPYNDAFYIDLFITRGAGGINDYYRTQSHGLVDFEQSVLLPWRTVPYTKTQYWAAHPGRNDRINGACRTHGIDRTKYFAVIVIFNTDTGNSSSAGNGVLAAADNTNDMQVTFLAHEIGHCFGFMDSYDESDRTGAGDSTTKGWYWDQYDIMSARNVYSFVHPRWNVAGPSLCTASQDFCGWLPASMVHTPQGGATESYDLELYSNVNWSTNRLTCIKYSKWYIEFRNNVGWDTGLARPCVLIHSITPAVNAVAHNFTHINGVWNNEWPVGSTFGTSLADMKRFGGTRISVLGFVIKPGTTESFARIRITLAEAPVPRGPHLPPGKEPIGGIGPGDGESSPVALVLGVDSLMEMEADKLLAETAQNDVDQETIGTLARHQEIHKITSAVSDDVERPPPAVKVE